MIHPLQFLVIPTFLEKSLIAFSLIILFINIPQLSLGQNSPVTTGNEDFTEYVNPYAGIKLSYPSNWLAPISRDEACPCYITANLPGGKFLIGAMPVDSPNINQSCKCQSLTEYLSWELNDVQSHFDKFTLISNNETTIGANYPARQYVYLSTNASDDKPTRSFGIVTKVNNTFYLFEVHPEYGTNLYPEVKKVFDSIEFLPINSTLPKVPSFTNMNTIDQSGEPETSGGNLSELKILNHKSYVDKSGFLHVVGEVQNNTPNSIQLVKITSTYYGSNNQVVATDFTYTDPSGISAGDKAPFELILTSASIPISEIDHYKLSASYQ